MAFCKKMSGLLRQNVTQSHTPHMLNSLRLMSSKLFVGGLSFATDDQQLEALFSRFGSVTEAVVIKDRQSRISKGFGFVRFDDREAADAAVAAMNGQVLDGRNLRVNIADDAPSPPRFAGGGGGDFGGNGGFRGGYGN